VKIFLLEDDYSLNEAIYQILDLNNHIVDRFYNGEDAYENLNNIYDLYILDINVPDIDGLTILEKIKEFDNNKKVIIMSADNSIETISNAYNKGCIDFIKKPFHIKELELKIKMYEDEDKTKIKLMDTIYFDTQNNILIKDNVIIELTKKEQLLLSILIDNKNKVTSFDKIFHYVYNDIISNDSLRSLVKRLRKKLFLEVIESVLGLGYKINTLE
jgi:DNA-binding response OmpR family regulator